MANLKSADRRGKDAVGEMKPALQAKCTEIALQLAKGTTDTSKARYRVGAVINELKADKAKYGRSSVRHVARAVGRDEASLYNYAAVAAQWDRPTFDKLAGRKNSAGVPLSFSHFVAVVDVSPAKKRVALIAKALAESMSVRELEQVAGAGRTASSEEHTVEAHLHQIVRASEGLLDRAAEWSASLAKLDDEDTTPELVELLQGAAEKQRAVEQAGAANAGLLEARIEKATAELDGERAVGERARVL